MTTLLNEMIERVKNWPKERQDDVAMLIASMEETGTGVYQLSDDERRAVKAALEEDKKGDFVSDGDLLAFRNRHRS